MGQERFTVRRSVVGDMGCSPRSTEVVCPVAVACGGGWRAVRGEVSVVREGSQNCRSGNLHNKSELDPEIRKSLAT